MFDEMMKQLFDGKRDMDSVLTERTLKLCEEGNSYRVARVRAMLEIANEMRGR